MTNLQAPYGPLAFFLNLEPALSDFKSDVIEGLSKPQKSLSPMYFYDARGSEIFEKITELDAYYPTRTERKIMIDNADAIGEAIGARAAVLEYGAGAPDKIRRLLDMLHDPVAYIAMDISGEHLVEGMSDLATEMEDFPIAAICADFNDHVNIPPNILPHPETWLGYFPGSTLGNLNPENAARFLRRTSETLGPDALMLLGIDLYKDEEVLQRAYDDPEGVTAEFNLNVLRRMQSELGADLNLDDFEHLALVNHEKFRIEMHLRAVRKTRISLDGNVFDFEKGETLHTENSYKFGKKRFETLLEETPWRMSEVWCDENDWFAACLLSNT